MDDHMELTKRGTRWTALSLHEVNGETLQLSTITLGGSPKTFCYVKGQDGRFRWDYPHLMGYLLGFDVKATKKTTKEAHEKGIEILNRTFIGSAELR